MTESQAFAQLEGSPWWRGAVIYQVYPRSFADGNGDGVGDLPGLRARLGHIAGLGVEAVWLSPVFKSPMADFGYDVADYRAIDPLFGDLECFDRLLEEAHRLGLRLILDLALSHTSERHRWFLESRDSRSNAKADWYVWADAKPDGTPPNNWLSVFGGPAWNWEPRRGQYYLHNFLAAQPDLNLHHPEARAAALAEIEFWLARGVDGCRLDVANYYLHDPQLRDNPPRPPQDRPADGVPDISPYGRQRHLYDKSRP
ncbi:MAG: alpha-amylase family glycosyl hydrolase, partial [Rhodospirillaceae bacterium]